MSLELVFKDRRTIARLRAGFLGHLIDSFALQLNEQGYSDEVAKAKVRVAENFSNWIKWNRFPLQTISSEHVNMYIRYRRRKHKSPYFDVVASKAFMAHLQNELSSCKDKLPEQTNRQKLVENFRKYLYQERGLSSHTVKYYEDYTSSFLDECFPADELNLPSLASSHVYSFVRKEVDRCPKRAKLVVVSLRSFFRYLRYQGWIELDLAAAVPTVAQWRQSSIPRSLSPDEVRKVLSTYEGKSPLELRDRAILHLLARLGLRAGEVVSLTLDDIDWKEGIISVPGKGNRRVRMPIPVDVGETLAEYLVKGRRKSRSRLLFLRLIAPIEGISRATLSTEVARALNHAGVDSPKKGAHQFRHSLATEMLRQGASFAEIGELLRHLSPQSTEVYAKVDLTSLRQLAISWPGGVE